MKHFLLLLCFSASLCITVSSLSSDGMTLLSLMRSWTFVPSSLNSSWDVSDPTPCSWVGVQCDSTHNVVSLNLSDYRISGRLGPEIAHLTHLQTVDLSYNSFSGDIPPELGNCSMLENLDLSINSFTGKIPDSSVKFQKLQYLNLCSNILTGEIPKSLFQIPRLQYVYLNDNNLSVSIPTSVGNATELLNLYLHRNQLSGPIPSSIGNCSKLEELFLDATTVLWNCSGLTEFAVVNSNLTCSIPSSLGLLDKLTKLHLPENHLSGKIPPEIGMCKSLNSLHLYSNQLEGEIPSEIGMLSELQDLELFSNHLMGEIPLSIWKIPNLEHVLVYDNRLSGELPLEMTELKQLKNVTLFNNQFCGVIPQSLGINSSLVSLDFINNKFTGEIPPNLCFGKKLMVLNMGLNQLEGSIPPDVGSCTTLWRVILKQNNFTGVLPDFARNPNLSYMDISDNKIGGAIPSSLGKCTNLTDINLSKNKFTGLIPQELGNLVNLRTLNLAHNNLEGPLPAHLSNCSKMDLFDVGFNFLNEFKKLSELQLGGNLFGGEIPSSIGALQNLFYGLNLSANGLTGGVPLEIGKLKRLLQLDISLNNLTESLAALEDLTSLVKINISDNSFVGPVPETLVKLLNSSVSSYMGNPGLCVQCSSSDGLTCTRNRNLKPCDHEATSKKGLSKFKIAMIAIGSSLFIVVLLFGLVYAIFFRRRSKRDIEISVEEGPSSLLHKVLKATENLNDRHIIGRGAHGVVYKAPVGPDNVFAVKKIAFAGTKRRSLSMVREIQTIGQIRHRNLVRFEDFWFREGHGLILYRYMQNGSLQDVLHEIDPPPSLEWSIRYKIAVGVAHGLAYLHYDCDPAIVHRDIKPSNILLDSDMEPHIADFGLAKLLDQSYASTMSGSVHGTIGYIAPENAYATRRSRESDVYSYGVVLLELITRKKAVDPLYTEDRDIVGWVRSVWSNTGEIDEIVDSSPMDEFIESDIMEQVREVLLVALRCTQKDPGKRPTMRDVIKQLLNPSLTRSRNSK
ncbi:receptor-like protein kinase [Quillaja saponaria]|uniref:non-specific serine/threonine protein kinase n=1 Tax=Quillaja saponaria TaxID=32244 RepID=A0AAD7L5X3_QUISA|nr:receptor-like protein kinase [Quillaja saponaria]